jgi:hypothetical protein
MKTLIPRQSSVGSREIGELNAVVCKRTKIWKGQQTYVPSFTGGRIYVLGTRRISSCMQDNQMYEYCMLRGHIWSDVEFHRRYRSLGCRV